MILGGKTVVRKRLEFISFPNALARDCEPSPQSSAPGKDGTC
jgi:hypothetical protein